MSQLVTSCPSCGQKKVQVTKIEWGDCGTRFEGRFEIPKLLNLSPDQIRFVVDFVKCSGSLKQMAKLQNVSYPTLRNQLNDLIEVIESLDNNKDLSKDKILQLLEEGKITAKQAAKKLQEL